MPKEILTDFQRRLLRLEATRLRMEDLLGKNRIRLMDVHSVYEALFIRAVAGFEAFLEELFFGILRGTMTYPHRRRVETRVSFGSRTALIAIVFQGDDYLDWLPFARTVDRAERFLVGGRPFSELDDGDKSRIKTIVTIRHAIAHESDYSMQEFLRIVVNNQVLMYGEKKPAGFLRSNIAPNRKRIEAYFADMLRIAKKLC